jgi:hypothetical protein
MTKNVRDFYIISSLNLDGETTSHEFFKGDRALEFARDYVEYLHQSDFEILHVLHVIYDGELVTTELVNFRPWIENSEEKVDIALELRHKNDRGEIDV